LHSAIFIEVPISKGSGTQRRERIEYHARSVICESQSLVLTPSARHNVGCICGLPIANLKTQKVMDGVQCIVIASLNANPAAIR